MTLSELISDVTTKLTRVGSNRVSAVDTLQSVLNVIAYFATQIADIIPAWTNALTFQTDGSDAGKYCTYPDTAGKKRIFETLVDDNLNHLPPTDPLITENTYWREISASSSAAIPEWAAGVYGPGLVIVYHNHSTAGRGLYVLLDPVRPYSSTNIETEITATKWQKISGTTSSGSITVASWSFVANANAFPTVAAGSTAIYMATDRHGVPGDVDFIEAGTWMLSNNPAGSSVYADFYYK